MTESDDTFIPDTMTPEEFAAAKHKLGLTDADLSVILNTNERSIRRWQASDGRGPNPVAVAVMLWMLDGFEPPELAEIRESTVPDQAAQG